MKKILSVGLSILLGLSLLSVPIFADNEVTRPEDPIPEEPYSIVPILGNQSNTVSVYISSGYAIVHVNFYGQIGVLNGQIVAENSLSATLAYENGEGICTATVSSCWTGNSGGHGYAYASIKFVGSSETTYRTVSARIA